jgi:hypothetical protein
MNLNLVGIVVCDVFALYSIIQECIILDMQVFPWYQMMKKARLWRSLESPVGVLRVKKCDKMRYFHIKKVGVIEL